MTTPFASSKLFHRAGALAGVALMLACAGGGGPSAPPASSETRSALARVTAAVVPPADATQLADDNRAFAADLYERLRTKPDNRDRNLIFSPESVSIALAMTYAGAVGNTAAQMASTLHFSLGPERLHPAFNALDLALGGRGQGVSGGFQLRLANAVWTQTGYHLEGAFLDTLALNYGAGVRLVDFAGATEEARLTINGWVSEQTAAKIPELLAKELLSADTRVVLTNAVYFKADWKTPFKGGSPSGIFHAPGRDVSVPTMSGPSDVSLWQGTGYRAASLPYVGDEVSMVLVVPDAGTFDSFEAGLTGERLKAILGSDAAGASRGALSMPRFAFTRQVPLSETLRSMGMPDAFDASLADFSRMNGVRGLSITDVVHEATIAVDEKGTEASAATAVVIGEKSAQLNALAVDRPFLFVIRDNPTGSILFLGRVVDPSVP